MAYLTDREKSILFSALTREERVCKEHGFDDLVKVCKRLTFLFSYNRFEKDIRKRAINEFQDKLMTHFADWRLTETHCVTLDTIDEAMEGIKEIADKIKRGNL